MPIVVLNPLLFFVNLNHAAFFAQSAKNNTARMQPVHVCDVIRLFYLLFLVNSWLRFSDRLRFTLKMWACRRGY